MAFKLLLAAERTWRRLNGHGLLPLVRAHVVFRDGERLERDDGDESPNLKKGRAKKIEEKSEKDAA